MFNNLGAIGNYTAPGAFRGQTFNTYTGGNSDDALAQQGLSARGHPVPQRQGGCGGIDVFGGSFSHISAEFKTCLRNITAALPGIAFQLALGPSPAAGRPDQSGPRAGDLDQQRPHQLLRDREGHRQHRRRGRRLQLAGNLRRPAIEMGLESDRDAPAGAARPTGPASCLPPGRRATANVRNKAPFVGNLTWKALQYTGSYLDDAGRELIMSMVGTIIYYPEESGARSRRSPRRSRRSASCSTARRAGSAPMSSSTCCAATTIRPATSVTNTTYPRALHGAVGDHDALDRRQDRHPHGDPQQSGEVGFVNQTTEPVYKMLGRHQHPGLRAWPTA